ncbi:zinc finger C3H1 domain-containing protein [Thomomys bottae]
MATAETSTPASSSLSPKEEGELEDGEISDDDNNSQIRSRSSSSSSGGGGGGGGGSGGGGGCGGGGGLLPYPRRRPPHPARGGGSGGGGGSSSSSSSSQQPPRNFSRSRHASERGHLRGHSSYRPKEPFRSHPPSARMPPSSLSESSPRPSFWERSHLALDRFRFRGRPYRGGSRWSRGRGVGERGGKPGGRPPLGGGPGSGFSSSQSWREPSPPRKSCILNVAVCPGCVPKVPFGVIAGSASLTFGTAPFVPGSVDFLRKLCFDKFLESHPSRVS